MSMLTRAQILKKTKLKKETINIPEWGGDIIISEMTGKERDAWEGDILTAREDGDPELNSTNARAKLAIRSVVDEDGNCIFTNDDIDAVGELSASALSRIFNVASRLSKLTVEDMKELEGN